MGPYGGGEKRWGYLQTFSTMVNETMKFKGNQVPIAIFLSSIDFKGYIKTNGFMINHTKLKLTNGVPDKECLESQITKLWLGFIDFLNKHK